MSYEKERVIVADQFLGLRNTSLTSQLPATAPFQLPLPFNPQKPPINPACLSLGDTLHFLRAPEGIESLVRVANERKVHLRHVLVAKGFDLRPVCGRVIALVDLVGGEVGDVHVGGEARFKGSADRSELVPVHPVEEGVLANVGAAELPRCGAKTAGSITEETVRKLEDFQFTGCSSNEDNQYEICRPRGGGGTKRGEEGWGREGWMV